MDKRDQLERHQGFESAFKNLWADNADEMSRRYTGVGALKSDFTRTGQRTAKGLMQDGIKSVQRTVQHITGDAQKQKLIDQFLGQVRAVVRSTVPGSSPAHVAIWAVDGLIVELDQRKRTLVCYNPSQQTEWAIPLDTIFCMGRVRATAGGVRIWLKTQPDPVKLVFKSSTARQEFVELCGALGALPTPTGDLSRVDVLTVSWNAPPVPSSAAVAFGHLPKGAKVIVLALQNVAFAVPNTSDPLIQSAGMTPDMYFVSMFRIFLEADYEMVQCCGGGAARTAVFVRLDVLPFLDNAYSCQVGTGLLAPGTSSVESLQPQKSFSSMMREKFTAVKQQLSQPSLQSPENAVGCACMLSVLGMPLCFLNVGDVTKKEMDGNPLISGRSTSSPVDLSLPSPGGKSYLYFMGSQASAFDPFNIYSASPNTFWLGCASPVLYDVTPWLCLASNDVVRGHILSLSPVLELMSSDPPPVAGGAASPAVGYESRPVACGFHIPLYLSTSGVRTQVTVSDVVVRVLNEPWPSLHLTLSSECAVDEHYAGITTPSSSKGAWAGPIVMNLLLCCGGSEVITVDVWNERTRLSRGRFLVSDAFNKPELSFCTYDSHGIMWGTCKLRTRCVVVPRAGGAVAAPSPSRAAPGSQAALPPVPSRSSGRPPSPVPPVPTRPPRGGGDLLDFGASPSQPPPQAGNDLINWDFMK